MITLALTISWPLVSVIVPGGIRKAIWSPSTASMSAWRKLPGPLSFVLVTLIVRGIEECTNRDWLGMPLVKTVTSAYPIGKPLELVVMRVIAVVVKELLDQPAIASTDGKSVCSLARLSSWTKG